MQGFQKVNDFYCKKTGHVRENIILICTHPNCQSRNRFLCFKCLETKQHHDHIEECIQYYFVPKFIDSSCRIIEQILQLQLLGNNHNSFKKFFEKKFLQLKELKIKFEDINFVKNHLESIEFAYNILSISKQFVKGFPQLAEQNFLIQRLYNFYRNNCNTYIEEFCSKAKNLKSHFLYEESIRCCNRGLDFELDCEIIFVKGKYKIFILGTCLNYLDCLEEAQDLLYLAKQLYPSENKIQELLIKVIESKNINYNKKIFALRNQKATSFQNIDFSKIKELVTHLDYKNAILNLNEYIEKDPEDFISITSKGFCLFSLGEFDQAKTICEQIQRLYPKYYQNLLLKAYILQKENKHNELELFIEENKPKFSQIVIAEILGPIYLQRQQYQETQKLLDEVPENMREDQRYKTLKFNFTGFKGQYEKMSEDQEGVKQLIGEFVSLANEGDFANALLKVEQALVLEPRNTICLKYKLILGLAKKIDYLEAKKTYDFMKEVSPNCEEIQDIDRELPWFNNSALQNQYYEAKRENFQALYKQGQQFRTMKQYDEAIKIYRRILYEDPREQNAQFEELICQIYNKNIDYALNEIENILKYKENYEKMNQLKGLALFKKKEYQQALDVYEKMIKKNPDHRLAEYSAANCYFKLRKYNQAKQIYERMSERTNCPMQIQSLKMRIYKSLYASHTRDEFIIKSFKEEFLNFQHMEGRYSSELQGGLAIWLLILCYEFNFPQIKQVEMLISVEPNFDLFKIILAKSFEASNELDKAISIYDQIWQKNPNNLFALVGICQAFQKQNQLEGLIQHYKNQALAINNRAFDQEVYDEIFIEELEKKIEKDIMCLFFEDQCQSLLPQMNMFF